MRDLFYLLMAEIYVQLHNNKVYKEYLYARMYGASRKSAIRKALAKRETGGGWLW